VVFILGIPVLVSLCIFYYRITSNQFQLRRATNFSKLNYFEEDGYRGNELDEETSVQPGNVALEASVESGT